MCHDYLQASRLGDDWVGAEWWAQVYKPGKGLSFHFDKDEEVMKTTGAMQHPTWSSVLYLNSAEECESPRLGATLVMNQTFDAAASAAVRACLAQRCPGVYGLKTPRSQAPDPFRECALVWPAANTFCVFDGRLAHGKPTQRAHPPRPTMPRSIAPAPRALMATGPCARRRARLVLARRAQNAPYKLASRTPGRALLQTKTADRHPCF